MKSEPGEIFLTLRNLAWQSHLCAALDGDMAGAMASEIGLGRLKQKTREELETLLDTARELDGNL